MYGASVVGQQQRTHGLREAGAVLVRVRVGVRVRVRVGVTVRVRVRVRVRVSLFDSYWCATG